MTPTRRDTDAPPTHKAVLAIVYTTFAAAFGLMGLCAYWWFAPYHVIDITNVKMASKVVYQGQSTTYSNDYAKHLDYPAKATRAFVDGIIYDGGSYEANLPVGSGHTVRPLVIPETLPPGKYHLHITLKYQVNPLRVVTEQFETDTFTVKANPNFHDDAEADALIKP